MGFGIDEQSLTTQVIFLIAFLPILIVEALCGTWALWRLHARPREGWLLLGAIALSAGQTMFGTTIIPLIFWLMSMFGAALSGEMISLGFSGTFLVLSLLESWLLLLGLFGPTPFHAPTASEGDPHPDRDQTPDLMANFLPFVAMGLSFAGPLIAITMLAVASWKHRAIRPRTCRWTRVLIGLRVAAVLVPWIGMWLSGTGLNLPHAETVESAVTNPEIWKFVVRCWPNTIIPAVEWGLISYLILEQPDLPRRSRLKEPAV